MTTLKDANRRALVGTLVFQAVLFWAALTGSWLQVATLEDGLKRVLQSSPFVVILGVAVFLLQGVISSDLKARLVFCRFRGNPYPGAEAFSKWMYRDPRIDPDKVRAAHGLLPEAEDPDKQNSLWYRLLKKHELESAVQDAHGRYLLARDLATNWLLFGLPSGVLVWWGKSDEWVNWTFDCGTLIVLVTMILVARNHGHRLVTSVLAAESAE